MTGAVGAAGVPRTPKQLGRKAAKRKTAGRATGTLSPADRLAFLRDYLVRTRFDIMQDKETLTKLFYAKIVLFGALSLMLVSRIGIFAVLFLPVVLFLFDFYHKKLPGDLCQVGRAGQSRGPATEKASGLLER